MSLLPRREKIAAISTASLRLFAFELPTQDPELFRASRAVQNWVHKFRNAEQVISYLLTTQGREDNVGPRIEFRVVGMFEWTAPMIVFRKTPSLQSVQSHTTAALVYWKFKWSKSSARRFHVFLNVLTFGRGSVGGKRVSARLKSEWCARISCRLCRA